ncbi:RNA polymerase sigma factor [Telluribacter sp.]|jgi:RNA polymerase sigma-70 factor (ECF subfamily)|uniref:RNA polymerase sigma factor n=1 Tax=Telluribacter sp. TaxID=1978767 RepID=UPI002E13BA09|nr:sigma-70 family RNA polymerase sigma factor [Telluribacter sp.]
MQDPKLTDEELVSLLRTNDANAYEIIYRRYWRPIYGYVFQQLGSKEDTEEIVHDLMLSLWANRQHSNIQCLRVYLLIAARNLTNKFIKSQINLRKYREYQVLRGVWESSETSELIGMNDLSAAVENILNGMPEKTARIFRMSKIDEMPVKTIASQMDLTEKAVEYHITKSLKLLRKQLENYTSDN